MTKQKPVELRLGLLKATIWEQHNPKGKRYNASFSRLYHDGANWQSSGQFGRGELLALAKLVDQVHTWMHEHPSDESQD